jgi:mannose-6-phosphate isomerase
MIVEKPWGYERIIEKNDTYVVKELVVNPGHRLSLQYHERKVETMFIVSGSAKLELSGKSHRMIAFNPYLIAAGQEHRLINDGTERVRVVEVSTPQLDDIVRLEDDYKRIV